MSDRSLDEFTDADSEADGAATTSDPPESEAGAAATSDPPESEAGAGAPGPNTSGSEAAVEPAESTYVRDVGGGECVACGATVERRWQGEDGLVCPDCKAW